MQRLLGADTQGRPYVGDMVLDGPNRVPKTFVQGSIGLPLPAEWVIHRRFDGVVLAAGFGGAGAEPLDHGGEAFAGAVEDEFAFLGCAEVGGAEGAGFGVAGCPGDD